MLSLWAKESGLNVNPAKTELVLFTKKRISNFPLPTLNGVSLTLSDSAKFLGIILDNKLNWVANLDERIRKSYAALYSCQKLVGKTWGLKPKLLHWIYKAIIRPVILYGSHVWWPILELKKYTERISKVNRIALLSLSGAMGTTSTESLEIIFDIVPLDLYVKYIAKATTFRLDQTSCLNSSRVRHLNAISNRTNNLRTDYVVPYSVTEGRLNTVFPTLDDWVKGNVKWSDINIFTDGSKTPTGTGSGYYCRELNIDGTYRLSNDCSIFQAEIYAIYKAAEQLSMMPIFNSDISFFIDSQAAIRALNAENIRSRVVSRCHRELMVLREQHRITLCWVPGHKDILGNEKADEFARNGASLPANVADPYINPPLSYFFEQVRQEIRQIWKQRCAISSSSHQTKILWDGEVTKNSKLLLDMSKKQLRIVINLVTGHNTLGKHLVRIKRSNDDTCRWCEEAVEDSFHFLCECPALSQKRFNILGSYIFQDLLDLRGRNPWTLLEYIKSSKWNA